MSFLFSSLSRLFAQKSTDISSDVPIVQTIKNHPLHTAATVSADSIHNNIIPQPSLPSQLQPTESHQPYLASYSQPLPSIPQHHENQFSSKPCLSTHTNDQQDGVLDLSDSNGKQESTDMSVQESSVCMSTARTAAINRSVTGIKIRQVVYVGFSKNAPQFVQPSPPSQHTFFFLDDIANVPNLKSKSGLSPSNLEEDLPLQEDGQIIHVRTDFHSDSWDAHLIEAGYDWNQHSAWVLDLNTNPTHFSSEHMLDIFLRMIFNLTTPLSKVIISYVPCDHSKNGEKINNTQKQDENSGLTYSPETFKEFITQRQFKVISDQPIDDDVNRETIHDSAHIATLIHAGVDVSDEALTAMHSVIGSVNLEETSCRQITPRQSETGNTVGTETRETSQDSRHTAGGLSPQQVEMTVTEKFPAAHKVQDSLQPDENDFRGDGEEKHKEEHNNAVVNPEGEDLYGFYNEGDDQDIPSHESELTEEGDQQTQNEGSSGGVRGLDANVNEPDKREENKNSKEKREPQEESFGELKENEGERVGEKQQSQQTDPKEEVEQAGTSPEKRQNILEFRLHVESLPHNLVQDATSVVVIGSDEAVGQWQPESAHRMRGDLNDVTNSLVATVNVTCGVTSFEYKYALVTDNGDILQWEEGPNRIVEVPLADNKSQVNRSTVNGNPIVIRQERWRI